jgi:4-hydroxy-tetrahydrodipicolinate reductase
MARSTGSSAVTAGDRLRVVQWATGNIGTRALRTVIEHPRMELVGVRVHSADKVGRDAGDLCGAPPTGVMATDSIDAILALAADCVLYMPRQCDFDEVCRLLASGANVVTTRGEFHHAGSMDPAVRASVEAACAQGGTSIHSTGSSPGFITEALPLALASIQRRLDRLAIDEYADLSRRNSPALLFDIMGFGRPPHAFDQRRADHLRDSFGPSLRVLADAISLPLDEVVAFGELAVATHPVRIAAGLLEEGTVAGQRTVVSGRRGGAELLRFCATWYCSADLEPNWELRSDGWRVVVGGDAPVDVDIRFPVPLERWASVSPGYTAHRAVNAVAAVCAAAPGIRSITELDHVVPVLG